MSWFIWLQTASTFFLIGGSFAMYRMNKQLLARNKQLVGEVMELNKMYTASITAVRGVLEEEFERRRNHG